MWTQSSSNTMGQNGDDSLWLLGAVGGGDWGLGVVVFTFCTNRVGCCALTKFTSGCLLDWTLVKVLLEDLLSICW